MVSPTLTGIGSLGKVQDESFTVDAGIAVLPSPYEDEEYAEIYGDQGATLNVNASGVYTAADGDLGAFVASFRALIDADPRTTRTWTSTLFPGGIGVVVVEAQIAYGTGQQSLIRWQLKMVHGEVF